MSKANWGAARALPSACRPSSKPGPRRTAHPKPNPIRGRHGQPPEVQSAPPQIILKGSSGSLSAALAAGGYQVILASTWEEVRSCAESGGQAAVFDCANDAAPFEFSRLDGLPRRIPCI